MAVPDFLIIGAPKCGTSWMLRNFQRQYDRIEFPKGANEINFFNIQWRRGLEWYESRFPDKEGRDFLYGEKTPSYIYGLERPKVAKNRFHVHERMHSVVPEAKLVLCLRRPADRAFSHWHMTVVNNRDYDTSFEEAVAHDRRNMDDPDYVRFRGHDFVQKGFYIEYIENLLRHYPRERLHVCFTEELKADVKTEYAKILRFLGVEPRDDADYHVSRRLQGYRHEFDPKVRAELDALYEPWNRRLFEFLGHEVPAWSR